MAEKNIREGQTGIQFYAPDDIHHDFKMACLVNRKSIREVILNYMYAYIKENRKHVTKSTRTG